MANLPDIGVVFYAAPVITAFCAGDRIGIQARLAAPGSTAGQTDAGDRRNRRFPDVWDHRT
jgi:hypothetical protein